MLDNDSRGNGIGDGKHNCLLTAYTAFVPSHIRPALDFSKKRNHSIFCYLFVDEILKSLKLMSISSEHKRKEINVGMEPKRIIFMLELKSQS